MLGVVSKYGLCGEISGPGCISDSSRTGLSASQQGVSIKKGRLWKRSSSRTSTERWEASSVHILTETEVGRGGWLYSTPSPCKFAEKSNSWKLVRTILCPCPCVDGLFAAKRCLIYLPTFVQHSFSVSEDKGSLPRR